MKVYLSNSQIIVDIPNNDSFEYKMNQNDVIIRAESNSLGLHQRSGNQSALYQITNYNNADELQNIQDEFGSAFANIQDAITYLNTLILSDVEQEIVVIESVTGQDIDIFSAVMLVNDLAYNYDTSDASNINRFAGIAIENGLLGTTIKIQKEGIIDISTVFIEGEDIYSDANGLLTNTQSSPVVHILAKAIDTSKILIVNNSPAFSATSRQTKYITDESQLTLSGDTLTWELSDFNYVFEGIVSVTKPFKIIGNDVAIYGHAAGLGAIDCSAIDSDIQGAFIQSVAGASITIGQIEITGGATTDFVDISSPAFVGFLNIRNADVNSIRDLGKLNNISSVQIDSLGFNFSGTGFDISGSFGVILCDSFIATGQSAVNSALFYSSTSVTVFAQLKISNAIAISDLAFGINLPETSFGEEGLRVTDCQFTDVDSPVSADQNSINVLLLGNTATNDTVTELINTALGITMENITDTVTPVALILTWYDLQWDAIYFDVTWFTGETLITGEKGVRYDSSVKTRFSLRLIASFFAAGSRDYKVKAIINNTDGVGNVTSLAREVLFPPFQTLNSSKPGINPVEIDHIFRENQHIHFEIQQISGAAIDINLSQYSRLLTD